MKLGFDITANNMMMCGFGMMQQPEQFCYAIYQNLNF